MSYASLRGVRVLVVDDDRPFREHLRLNLEAVGCLVETAPDVVSAEEALSRSDPPFSFALLDLYLPESIDHPFDRVMRGEELAYTFGKRSPLTRIIGMSENVERLPFTPVRKVFGGFVFKGDLPHGDPPLALLETLEGLLLSPSPQRPRIFIVHGRDSAELEQLKDLLQTTFELGEPIVLRERPSLGRTIIEKFEQETRGVDLVFVLLTSDDQLADSEIRRSRQNVIFEAGFFYGKLQRTTGRVFILRSGPVEIPSDIAGVVFLDITGGVAKITEELGRELRATGWLERAGE